MRAMILAAGRGERMRPLTDHCPKPLLQVGGKRLIEYHLDACARAGIQQVVINTAWQGQQFPELLGDGSRYGIRIDYSDEGATALETAGGIIHALNKLGDEPFIVINGDIWTDYDLGNLVNKSASAMHLVLVQNPVHHPDGDFDLDQDNYLTNHKRYTFSGIGLYSPEIFTTINIENSVQPLAPIIRQYIEQRQVTGELYQGKWFDIGTPERLQQLDKQLLQGI